MSTLLRGITTIGDACNLSISGLKIEPKGQKGDKAFFLIEVADRDFMDFNGQIQDTIAFLSDNIDSLKYLKKTTENLSWYLDFGYDSRLTTGELAVERLLFPLELLKLCTDLGIELNVSLYDSRMFDSD